MQRIFGDQHGNIALYVSVVLPVALTLGTVLFDVSAWQGKRQNAQREVDRIAYEASLLLPDIQAAEAAIVRSLAALPQIEAADGSVLLEVTSSTVSLTVKIEHQTAFSNFLGLSTDAGSIAAYASAAAGAVPQDIFLIVADASTLRPEAHSAWGSESSWPPSSYFSLIGQPHYAFEPPNQPPLQWPLWWEDDFFSAVFRRWATQLCFNPAYSPIKLSAMALADIVSAGRLNRVGVIFSPGDSPSGPGFAVGRELLFADEDAAETFWSTFYEARSASSDEACVYYSDARTTADSRYLLPEPAAPWMLSGASGCSSRIEVSPLGDPRGHQPDPALHRLSSCYRSGGAPLREVLYFHAVRPHQHSADGVNLINGAQFALSRLILASHLPGIEASARRKNLATKTLRRIVVLTDFLPDPGHPAFAALIDELQQEAKSAQLTFLVFQHEFLPASLKALNEARAASINAAGPFAGAQLATTAEELERLAGGLLHYGRQLALRS